MATQKDYEMIAKVLSDARGRRQQSRLDCLLQLTVELAAVFEADNPKFDRDLFTISCMNPQPDMEHVMTARRKAKKASGSVAGWRNHLEVGLGG